MNATFAKIKNDVTRNRVIARAEKKAAKVAAYYFASTGRLLAFGERFVDNHRATCERCLDSSAREYFDETGETGEWLETHVQAYIDAAFAWRPWAN